MSAVSSTFEAHWSVHFEKRAISLSLKVLPFQPRLARNRVQVRNSVRPMHLFGHTFDHDYYFELPVKGSGIPNQFLGVLLSKIRFAASAAIAPLRVAFPMRSSLQSL